MNSASQSLKVDIMMPFWGDVDLLRSAVKSVLGQDSPDWRLVVIDDAYPDQTVPEYFAGIDDPRVEYRRNERNVGLIENFRRAVAGATADLVVVMGCDDLLDPAFVSVAIKAAISHPDAAFLQPGVRVVDGDGREWLPLVDRIKGRLRSSWEHRPQPVGGEELAASLLHGNWLYWPSLVFRREVIQSTDFRDEYRIILDLALITDLLQDGALVAIIPTKVFRYRRHAASVSSSEFLSGARFADERRYFRATAVDMRARGWTRAAWAARLHLTSRLYAASLIPGAVRTLNGHYVRDLLKHFAL